MKKYYDIYFDTIKKGDKYYNIMTTEIDKKIKKNYTLCRSRN